MQTAFFILAHARQKQGINVQKPILLFILQDTVQLIHGMSIFRSSNL